jgi:hypothetical protein
VSVSAFLLAYSTPTVSSLLLSSALLSFPVVSCCFTIRPLLLILPTATVVNTNTTDDATPVHRRRHLIVIHFPHPCSSAETQHPTDDCSLRLPGFTTRPVHTACHDSNTTPHSTK